MHVRRVASLGSVAAVALSLLSATSASGQAPGYMTIQSSSLGLVTAQDLTLGSVGQWAVEGHEDQALVLSFSHQVSNSGGGVSHDSVVVVKPVSRSSPLLYRMMLTGDTATVTVGLYRISMSGAEENYFTVTLNNARVVAMAPHVAGSGTGATATPQLESVAFSYGTITWQHTVCGTSYSTTVAPP